MGLHEHSIKSFGGDDTVLNHGNDGIYLTPSVF